MTINPDYDGRICPGGTITNYPVRAGRGYIGAKPKPGNADVILGSPSVRTAEESDRLNADLAKAQVAVKEALHQ